MRVAIAILTSAMASGCALDFDGLSLGPGSGGGSVTTTTTGSGGGGSTTANVGGGGSGPTTGGGGSTGSGLPTCGDMGGLCAPPAPTGWKGPIILRPGSTCDSGNPDLVLGSDAKAVPTTCGCAKSGSESCSGPALTLRNDTCANGSAASITLTPDLSCKSLVNAKSVISGLAASPPTGVACTAANTPGLVFDDAHAVCAVAASAQCGGDGSCIEPGLGESICVYQLSPADCPLGSAYVTPMPFLTATVACACDAPTFNCAGQTKVAEGGCAMNGQMVPTDGTTCVNLGSAPAAVFVPDDAMGFAGQCTDNPPTVNTKAVTVCCALP